jgi:probable HAF family extracellular repeat protein
MFGRHNSWYNAHWREASGHPTCCIKGAHNELKAIDKASLLAAVAIVAGFSVGCGGGGGGGGSSSPGGGGGGGGAAGTYSVRSIADGPAGINDAGQIAAGRESGAQTIPGILTLGGAFTPIQESGGMGRTSGIPAAIDRSGDVTGQLYDSTGMSWAFLYKGGVLTFLASNAQGNAINNNGEVAGDITTSDGMSHPAAWFNSGQVIIDSSNSGAALAINDSGQVAGTSFTSSGGRAFIWQSGSMTILPNLPGGSEAFVSGMNNAGVIVGSARDSSGANHAVKWQGGVITDLGMLSGSNKAGAQAINDSGQIIGHCGSGTSDSANRGTLWQNGQIIDLNTKIPSGSGMVIQDPACISNDGKIAGYYGMKRWVLLPN